MTVAHTAIVITGQHNGQVYILLVQQRNNRWSTPGGNIDSVNGVMERPWHALRREFAEETNNTRLPRIIGLSSFDFHGHTRIYYGRTTDRVPNRLLRNNSETCELKWINIDDVRNASYSPNTRIVLRSCVASSFREMFRNNYL
jgi:8-oxo-dGTP pyrophosphatase MutT (NUDIX family)